jgi:cation/acetate symporter
MFLNFGVGTVVSLLTPPPPPEIQQLVEDIRVPSGAGPAHEIRA